MSSLWEPILEVIGVGVTAKPVESGWVGCAHKQAGWFRFKEGKCIRHEPELRFSRGFETEIVLTRF